MFKANFNGVEEAGDFSPVPDGTYALRVLETEEAKTRNGDPMVKVTLEVTSHGLYSGKKVFHNVTFFKPGAPGAGFSKHWLHVIGQPYEGEVSVQPIRWRGARLEADLIVEEYPKKDGSTGRKNTLASIRSLSKDAPAPEKEIEDTSQVPF